MNIVLGFSTGSNYSNGDWSNLKPVLRKDPNLVYLPDPESTEEEEENTSYTTPFETVSTKLAVRPLYIRICPWEDLEFS